MDEQFDKKIEQNTINFETEAEASSMEPVPEKKFNLGKEILSGYIPLLLHSLSHF